MIELYFLRHRERWAAMGIAAVVLVMPGPAAAHVIDAAGPAESKPVYVVSHGWHVGLALRRDEIAASNWADKDALGPFRYLEIGWGDGDYYPAPRGTIFLALRAAFRSRWSVLQVIGFDATVTDAFPRSKILEIDVSPDGLAALARYIHGTYARDGDGHPIIVGPAQYGIGFFYLARGRYRLSDNSNTWVAKALQVAGCPIDVEVAITAGSVLHQAARFGRLLRPGTLLHRPSEVPEHCR
jgi:uncharacterized protein (TIGR02117 family)